MNFRALPNHAHTESDKIIPMSTILNGRESDQIERDQDQVGRDFGKSELDFGKFELVGSSAYKYSPDRSPDSFDIQQADQQQLRQLRQRP